MREEPQTHPQAVLVAFVDDQPYFCSIRSTPSPSPQVEYHDTEAAPDIFPIIVVLLRSNLFWLPVRKRALPR